MSPSTGKAAKPCSARSRSGSGDPFQGLYETADVPYTMYEITKGDALIGYIHGVNQKGTYGGLQVFLALDTRGDHPLFLLPEADVEGGESASASRPSGSNSRASASRISMPMTSFRARKRRPDGSARIRNPVPEAESDFRAALRATKKNLILADEFLLGNRHLNYFKAEGERP